MPSPKKPLREWQITLILRKGQYLDLDGIEAPDAATGIEHATAELDIDEAALLAGRH